MIRLHTLLLTALALTLAACDSSSPAVESQSGPSVSSEGYLQFADQAEFDRTVEETHARTTAERVDWGTGLGFDSLLAAQRAALRGEAEEAAPMPDDVLAALLDVEGRVRIGDLVHAVSVLGLRTTDPAGRVVSDVTFDGPGDGPVTVDDARAIQYVGSKTIRDYGPIVRDGKEKYRLQGEAWYLNYGFYASAGGRTDNYTLESNWYRGSYYADDRADQIGVQCDLWIPTEGTTVYAPINKTNESTVKVYTDVDFIFTLDDFGSGQLQCDHRVREGDYNPSYDITVSTVKNVAV